MAPRETSGPTVSVIVVTYQSAKFVEACLKSIERYAGAACETVVVDNASTDQTTGIVSDRYGWASLLRLDENRWYTAAANMGAARARGRYLLFLNPDAELTEVALPALVRHLE